MRNKKTSGQTKYKSIDSGVRNVEFGENVKIVHPVNLYDCSIGCNCFIGPFVEIQSRVVVGEGTRVQSHSFICSDVEIGRDCFIGHGVMFINDKFKNNGPARGDKNFWGVTNIGDRVAIGSNATILPVNICDDVIIGAGAVVTKDIMVSGVYAGNPARFREQKK